MTTAAHARPGRTTPAPWAKWRATSAARVTSAARALKGNSVTIRSATLQVGGLGLFTASAAGFDLRLGGIVAGISCFVLNYLLTDPPAGGR